MSTQHHTGRPATPAPNSRTAGAALRRVRALALLAAIAGLLTACCAGESQFLRPLRIIEALPPRAENIWIDAPDSGRLNAWLFRPQAAAPGERLPAVLFLHGRSDSIATYRDLAPWLADRTGAAMLLIDYRGWGASSDIQCPTRRSIIADAHAAYDWLAAQPGIDADRLAVWGASLGGYPATSVFAHRPDATALVLWASPADVRWLIDDLKLSPGARVAIHGHSEPRDQIRRVGPRPVLLVHPLHDEIIPVRHAEEIADRARAAGVPLDLFVDPEGSHMVVSQNAINRIADFIARSLGTSAAGRPPAETSPAPAPRFPPRSAHPLAEPHAGHTSPSTSSTEFPAGSRTQIDRPPIDGWHGCGSAQPCVTPQSPAQRVPASAVRAVSDSAVPLRSPP